MATLKPETFGQETTLLAKVRQALSNLTGFGTPRSASNQYPFPIAASAKLFQLDAERDSLNANYKSIWHFCSIEFNAKQAGAEICVPDRRIILGPFMKNFGVKDLEKVILHEFLHASLDDDWQPLSQQAQHGQINLIIRFNLQYPPPPNPANPSED